MATRREFLQAGIAASTVPIAAGVFRSDRSPATTGSTPARGRTALPLYKTVFDKRFPESASFAAEMRQHGVATHGIVADMTDLWYSDLHLRWIKSPVSIAGLTAHGPLFCLERLAWDHGMRVVFRAEHLFRRDGSIEHIISAEQSVLRDATRLQTAGSNWTAHVAKLVSWCGAGAGRFETCSFVTPQAQPRGTAQEPLFSWVIAIRART